MSGNVTTAGDVNVMPGGTLRVAKTTIGGNLENGGTVQMNSEGGKPGNGQLYRKQWPDDVQRDAGRR